MPRRRLRPNEIREAEQVFASEIPYGRVWIHEYARWPNWIAAAGARLTRSPAPRGGNSVTLGRNLYFPHPLRTDAASFEARVFGDMAWLIHELAHVWQFTHGGYRYAWVAVREQLRNGPSVYAYGGEDGLRKASAKHFSLSDFNPEQQADIARDYYLRKRLGLPAAAWEPFIAELRPA